ncbi:MAG: nitrogenase component 1, partial [Chloroflexi bacterium]|nr:nitrogenase component 1 [Chloroflexota bacterium]
MSKVLADMTQNSDAFYGSFVAAYGLRDAFCIAHSPKGCQQEPASLWQRHDVIGDSPRLVMTHLKEDDFIFGAEHKVVELVRYYGAMDRVGVIALMPNAGASLLVEDLQGAIDSVRDDIKCEVVVLPSAGFSGDMYQGFANSLGVFVEQLVAEPERKIPRSANVLGYFMHRYEADETASVVQIRHLLGSLGVEVVSVLMEGAGVETLKRAGEAEVNLVLPYGREAARVLEDRFGQSAVAVDLPLGLDRTCAFLRQVGAAFGLEKEAEEIIRRELKRVVPPIYRVMSYTQGHTFGLFVDPAKTPGFLTYCTELGMVPAVVGIMGNDEPTEEGVRETIASFGDKYEPFQVLIDPARFEITDVLKEVRPDVVIGSCTEEEEARALGIAGYTVTFPMVSKRALYPRPLLG